MSDIQTLLITGGTGSFGNAVLKRFLSTEIGQVRIFSRDEKKQDDMRRFWKSNRVEFYIGDIREKASLDSALKGVDYVFHAAALKQVPSCEFFPMEAVLTNVLGTDNVLLSAIENRVKKVAVLSTDKAVYPINAMGISKAMMEKIAISRSRTSDKTGICITRYGNVMASRGSVIQLFIQQILSGEPLTVTDPNMTRYLMSLEDAVDLAFYAFKNTQSGDTFVQKAPASTIGDLAQAVKEIMRVPDHPVHIIGTRHGEKLYETLLTREEMARAEDQGGYYHIPADNRDLNYSMYFSEGKPVQDYALEYTSHNTKRLNIEDIKKTLLNLEYIQEVLKVHGK